MKTTLIKDGRFKWAGCHDVDEVASELTSNGNFLVQYGERVWRVMADEDGIQIESVTKVSSNEYSQDEEGHDDIMIIRSKPDVVEALLQEEDEDWRLAAIKYLFEYILGSHVEFFY